MASTAAPTTNITTPPSPPPESLPAQALAGVKNLLGLNHKPKPETKREESNTLAPPQQTEKSASILSTTSVQSAPYVSSPVPSEKRPDNGRPDTRHTGAVSPPLSPSSPRFPAFASTASENQIFERSVQEPPSQQNTSAAAIPSHITTEDYIPPVLEASCAAITDDTLDPDEVEIVTKVGHVPLVVAGAGTAVNTGLSGAASVSSGGLGSKGASRSHSPEPRGTSPYATSETGEHDSSLDKRRLSFISFADVVQSENAEAARFSPNRSQSPNSHHSRRSTSPTSIKGQAPPSPPQKASILPAIPNFGVASIGEALGLRGRSPSPVGSSPGEKGLGGGAPLTGEGRDENVETLGTALRKPGNGEL